MRGKRETSRGIPVAVVAAVLALLLVLPGCAAMGRPPSPRGYADLWVIEPLTGLRGFASFQANPFSNELGDGLSQPLLDAIDAEIARTLKSKGLARPDGRTVSVTGQVIHIDQGPFQKAIVARVAFREIASGKLLCIVNVTGRVEGNRPVGDAVPALADGIARFILQQQSGRGVR